MELERRYVQGGVEVRAMDGGKWKIQGYAARFNARSLDLGGFYEELAPVAFDRAIKEAHDVRALVDHIPSQIIGRSTAGTLRLFVDSDGLGMEIDPPDTQVGRDIQVSIGRGDVTGTSFQFSVPEGGDKWSRTADGMLLRTVFDLKLYDVGPVTFPAYPQTSVSARCMEMVRAAVLPVVDVAPPPMERLAREVEWMRRG